MNRDGALQLLTKRPQILRRLALGAFDSLLSGGAVWSAITWVPVQAKGLTSGAESNRERTMRSDRLEAHRAVLTKLLSHMDIVTGDLCRDVDKTFYGIKVETIAEDLGLDQRRVERVLCDLHAAGLIQSWKRAERKGDGFRGRTSVRKLAASQIATLVGIGKDWLSAVQQAVQERRCIPPSPQQLALKALKLAARAGAQARSVADVLSGAVQRAGAPPGPPLGPPLKAR